MTIVRKPLLALYVDRSNQQWIVLDPEGCAVGADILDPHELRTCGAVHLAVEGDRLAGIRGGAGGGARRFRIGHVLGDDAQTCGLRLEPRARDVERRLQRIDHGISSSRPRSTCC